jgi:hypothetical protein
MKTPDFLGTAQQTWQQIKRFPTSDALADAVLIHALYELVMAPFPYRKYFLRETWQEKWTWFSLPLGLVLTPLLLLWHFNLSLRIRGDEAKARRTAVIYSSCFVFLTAASLQMEQFLRKGVRELSEEELARMDDEQITGYEAARAALPINREKYALKPMKVAWTLVTLAFHLNVLFRAFQPATGARFRKP